MNGDKNYDVEVTQIPTASNDSTEYSLLLKHSDSSSTETDTVNTTRNARFTYKPSTNALNASYYNGNTLVRKTIYGSAGFRTQGGDSLNRSVNAEYLQEGFNVKYTPTYSGGDLTSAGIDFQINEYGGYGHQPNLEIYNTRYASDSQDSGVNREGVIDHESIKVYEDHFNDNYASLSSQYKGFQADKDNIYLIHQEWSQGSTTPTTDESIQIEIDDITLAGNTWDGTNTSLKSAIEAAGQSGGGSTVTITPSLSSGTKVADYSINGVSGSLYAPSGGGGSGSDGSLVIANNDMRPSSGYWGGGASGSTAYLSTTVNWVENIGSTLTLDNGYLTEVDSVSVDDGHFAVGKIGGVGTILIADDNGDGDVKLDNGGNGWTGYGSTSLKESLGHLFTNVSSVTDILVLNSSGYPLMVDSTSNKIADCHLFIGDSSNGGDGRITLADHNGSGDIGLDGSASWTGYGSTSLRESLGEIYTYALRESAFENISYNGYTGITAIEKMAEDLSANN